MTWKNAPSVGRHKLWALGLAIVVLAAPGICSAEEITIEVAPATLNLQSNGNVVTVHTDVSYGDVNVGTVYLGGVAIDSWKADDRGYFVAKFVIEAIKGINDLVIDDYNTLLFVALTTDNKEIWGAADVMVIDSGTGGKAE